jgi:hypothetical protein
MEPVFLLLPLALEACPNGVIISVEGLSGRVLGPAGSDIMLLKNASIFRRNRFWATKALDGQ